MLSVTGLQDKTAHRLNAADSCLEHALSITEPVPAILAEQTAVVGLVNSGLAIGRSDQSHIMQKTPYNGIQQRLQFKFMSGHHCH